MYGNISLSKHTNLPREIIKNYKFGQVKIALIFSSLIHWLFTTRYGLLDLWSYFGEYLMHIWWEKLPDFKAFILICILAIWILIG